MGLGDISATDQTIATRLNSLSAGLDNIGLEMAAGTNADVSLGAGAGTINAATPGAGDLFALGRKTQSVETAQQTITIAPTAKDKMAQSAVREAKQG